MKQLEQTTMLTSVLSAFRILTVLACVRGTAFEQLEREQIIVADKAALEDNEGVQSISRPLKEASRLDIGKVWKRYEQTCCRNA